MKISTIGRNDPCFGSRLFISRIVKLPTVRNDDVGHRLLGIARPFQNPVAAPIAIQDYPSPVTVLST